VLRLDQPYTRGERSRLAVTFLSGVAKKLQATTADADIAKVLTMDEARRIEQHRQAANATRQELGAIRWPKILNLRLLATVKSL
jgi:hypothetical protein